MANAGEEIIKEIRIATFWRHHLGDVAYTNYNPDDLYRWYEALELRGPDEVRAQLTERTGRHTATHMLTLAAPPHPTLELVEIWLNTHEDRVKMRPFWLGLAGFITLSLLILPNVNGCQNLRDPNRFILHPQTTSQPIQAAGPGALPASTSTLPATLPPVASQATQSTQPQPGH